MSEIIQRVKDILDIQDERIEFGTVLGNGEFSLAIKVDYPFLEEEVSNVISNAVMIISSEENKYPAMKSLFENVVKLDIEKYINEAKKEWLEYLGYETEEEANDECEYFYPYEHLSQFSLIPIQERLEEEGLEEEGLHVFYMEKCESYCSEEIYFATEIMQNLGCINFNSNHFAEFISGYETLDDIREVIDLNRIPDEIPVNTFLENIQNIIKIIERDIRRIASNMNPYTMLSLNIHPGQFIEYKGEVFCSDPFVMG